MRQLKQSGSERLANLICAFAAALLIAGYAAPAFAQNAPLVLREQINVYSDIVTLGHLFENAGDAAGSPVFRSPRLGTSGVVAARRVSASAQQHGLVWPNPGGITEIKVSRPGHMILMEEVRELVAERAAADDGEIYEVTFSRNAKPFYIDPRSQGSITVKQMDLNPRSGRFRVTIAAPEGEQNIQDKVFTGRAYPTVEAVVPTHVIDRGATIMDADLKMVRMPRMRVSETALDAMGSAVGMAAKQRLIVGRPVRRTDIEQPKLVKRNTIVTIIYRSPGLTLKAKGRALADASRGQSVAIINLQSKRTLEAEVTGNGLVSVSTLPAGRLSTARRERTSRRSRTAQRALPSRGGRYTNVIR